jgi:predicted DNA-binding transcriptional regulator YafY
MATSAAPRRDRQVVRPLTLLRMLKEGGRPSVHDLTARFHTRRETICLVWEKPMTVVVRFRADQAPYIRGREWHPTQQLKDLRDGRLELTFRAGGTFEITRWLLGWGDAAEVIRPVRLRREVAAILRSAATQYRPS